MEDNKTLKTAVAIGLAIVVAPVVIRTAMMVTGTVAGVIGMTTEAIKFHRRMKKEIKKGKAVKINGEYYNVDIIEPA